MHLPENLQSLRNSLYLGDGLEVRERIALYQSFIKQLEPVALSGNPEAQFEMGQHYEDVHYLGLNPDYSDEKRFFWYTKAAEQDHPDACNSLAVMYEGGYGTEVDLKLAHFYYRKAAELDHELARGNLEIFLTEYEV